MATTRHSKWHGRVEGTACECAVPGCPEAGEFRAPLIPGDPSTSLRTGFDGPGAYRLLCLEHVRARNARYNYFAGMSMEEIEAAQSPIAGWERETRAFATNGADRGPAWRDFADPLDAIATRFRPEVRREAAGRFSAGERHALGVLGLSDDVDRMALRKRYAVLLRRFHPDRNGGDRGFEKQLGEVIAAYQMLKGSRAFA